MLYEFRCEEGHIASARLLVEEYDALPRNETRDALYPCGCGKLGRRVYGGFFHTVDFTDGCGPNGDKSGGFDIGAGQVFKNRGDRKEWQRQNGAVDFGPENSETNDRYVREFTEASKEGIDPRSIPHPFQKRWDGQVKERNEKRTAVAAGLANRYLADREVCQDGTEADAL